MGGMACRVPKKTLVSGIESSGRERLLIALLPLAFALVTDGSTGDALRFGDCPPDTQTTGGARNAGSAVASLTPPSLPRASLLSNISTSFSCREWRTVAVSSSATPSAVDAVLSLATLSEFRPMIVPGLSDRVMEKGSFPSSATSV